MPDSILPENDFISQVNAVIEKNIANERFGVSELADEMNMSRSNLLRKVKKDTRLSVSQLISQVRLKRAMELLRKSSLNVSEVSHQVGFNSTSYFIKCFREYYGYPPGEVGKRDVTEAAAPKNLPDSAGKKKWILLTASAALIIAIAVLLYYNRQPSNPPIALEKSIIVLPFKNDSNDSTNVYLINGLMESTLNNLQKIKDLKVISRTSAEKYSMTAKSIPEMSRELNVNYFIEGSGQKIGDKILLNIQLIEGSTDRHLWSKQYRREVRDIFELQQEIARNIAEEIKVIITPEEQQRIGKKPTEDLVAYDIFLQGQHLLQRGDPQSAVPYFKKAIEHDSAFALAYAELAITYYYLDMFQKDKKYTDDLNACADKAMLFDPKLSTSLVAKALFYMHQKEYQTAVPYFEKALEYEPNSALVVNFLSDLYNNYIPNTGKYLQYALKGVRLDVSDSSSMSYNYLHLSNAFIQSGFVNEAYVNIEKSLAYNPDNFYSRWVRSFIVFARDKDIRKTKRMLMEELEKDSARIVMLEEVGKICFLMRDYDSAYIYYKEFLERQDRGQLEVFRHEYLRIALLLAKKGELEKSNALMKNFKEFAEQDRSIYKNLFLASYYANAGDKAKAIELMRLFAKEDNYQYWVLLMKDDPEVDPIRDMPEFKKLMQQIETKFWNRNKEIRKSLEEQGLL
jgi:TolB-like protein/AraC-like DNA-binding protein